MDYKKTDLLSSITKRTAETVPDSLSEADRAFFVNQVQSLKETQSRVFPAIFSKAANRLLGEVTQIYDQVRGEGAPRPSPLRFLSGEYSSRVSEYDFAISP
jgi:hypothetical protein